MLARGKERNGKKQSKNGKKVTMMGTDQKNKRNERKNYQEGREGQVDKHLVQDLVNSENFLWAVWITGNEATTSRGGTNWRVVYQRWILTNEKGSQSCEMYMTLMVEEYMA